MFYVEINYFCLLCRCRNRFRPKYFKHSRPSPLVVRLSRTRVCFSHRSLPVLDRCAGQPGRSSPRTGLDPLQAASRADVVQSHVKTHIEIDSDSTARAPFGGKIPNRYQQGTNQDHYSLVRLDEPNLIKTRSRPDQDCFCRRHRRRQHVPDHKRRRRRGADHRPAAKQPRPSNKLIIRCEWGDGRPGAARIMPAAQRCSGWLLRLDRPITPAPSAASIASARQ